MRRHGYHSASRDDYNLFEAFGDFVGYALMNENTDGKTLVDAETLWRLGLEIAKQVDRIRKNDYPKIEWTYNGGINSPFLFRKIYSLYNGGLGCEFTQ